VKSSQKRANFSSSLLT